MVLISFNGLAMILVFSSLSMTCLVHLRICMILSPARKEVGKRLASPQARVIHHFEQKIVCSSDLSCPAAGGLSQSYSSLGRAGEEQH